MEQDAVKAAVLDLLRADPEVQGAVLALLAGALNAPQGTPDAAPVMPQQRQKPDWVLRQLQAQEQDS